MFGGASASPELVKRRSFLETFKSAQQGSFHVVKLITHAWILGVLAKGLILASVVPVAVSAGEAMCSVIGSMSE